MRGGRLPREHTAMAEPSLLWHAFQWRLEAVGVRSFAAAVAKEKLFLVIAAPAVLTDDIIRCTWPRLENGHRISSWLQLPRCRRGRCGVRCASLRARSGLRPLARP